MDKIGIKNRIGIVLCCLLLLAVLLFSGCIKKEDTEMHADDYSLYYSYKGNLKGIEVYCWKSDGAWFSGILPGKNSEQKLDEIR